MPSQNLTSLLNTNSDTSFTVFVPTLPQPYPLAAHPPRRAPCQDHLGMCGPSSRQLFGVCTGVVGGEETGRRQQRRQQR